MSSKRTERKQTEKINHNRRSDIGVIKVSEGEKKKDGNAEVFKNNGWTIFKFGKNLNLQI